MSRSLEKLTSLLLLSYNMKTSLICCMNGNRTIEVLVSQCKTVFSPLFPSLSSTSSSRGNCTDCRHSPLSYSSAGYRTQVVEFSIWTLEMGGFQLEFVSISRVINHMACYNFECSHWLKLQHSDWRANLVKDFLKK